MHQSVVLIVRFFYHDDISFYFRAYNSSLPYPLFFTSFYYCCVLTRFPARINLQIAYFLHNFGVIHYVPNDNFLSPCIYSFFALLRYFSRYALDMHSILSRCFSFFHHICFQVGYYFPIMPTSCSTYDDGTQLHYRQQLRLEASGLALGAINKPGAQDKREKRR